ncbi:MAG: glycosyltransferase family 2 protein [Crocinitomicaceae bacterium]
MKITVVIPCRNEHLFIEECIHAIYSCEIPENMEIEVFVVDGMSDDSTRDKVDVLISHYPSLHLVDNNQQLTPFAFNLGIYAGGKTDFVQIVGARHILSSNYLMNSIKMITENSQVWCVGGRIINEYINETGRVISSAMSTTFGMGLGNFRTLSKSGFTDTVTSPMYPKFVFEKIGYFDENLIRNQDDDFNYRVTNAGGKIYYDHEISLKYYVRGNFNGLWKQFFQYGYWKVYVNKKHKAVTTLRQLVPPLFVLYLMLLLLTSLFSISTAGIFGIPFVAYIAMAVYFSLKASEQDKEIRFIEVLKTFPILHVSYGLGYLKGIWTFLILNQRPSDKQKELSR